MPLKKLNLRNLEKLYSSMNSQKKESKGMLKSYYSGQPGQFLEQLLIVPDLRLRYIN